MKGTIVEDGHIINFDRRCLHCNAYEVFKVGQPHSNLMENAFGTIVCRKPLECQNNLVAENGTALEVDISNEGVALRDKNGNEMMFKNDWYFIGDEGDYDEGRI